MDQDTALFKQLIDTFQVELEENLQRITDALLALEKSEPGGEDLKDKIGILFRSAHNIKGTAGSMGLQEIAAIAHQLESLFSTLQATGGALPADRVNFCLEGVDGMRSALHSLLEKEPLAFDL